MTSDEFYDWLEFHKGLFSGFGKWFADLPGQAVATWSEGLEGVSLAAAKEATREMAFGDLDEPRGYSKHLAAIRRRAREIAGSSRPEKKVKLVDGQVVYDCPYCQDSGLRTIYHPQMVHEVVNGSEDALLRTCVVGCPCGAARYLKLPEFDMLEPYACRLGHKNHPTGVANVMMIEVDVMTVDHLAAVNDGIEVFQGRNRVQAFDDWNER